ncbi:tRNA preQ1(34) S-adenosylmethionine ribosyltransferase-isomerase QueA [Candidatus Auribacterota bacterium]
MYTLKDFDYNLPQEFIAQQPASSRDASGLMVLDRKSGNIDHKRFTDIVDYLNEGDCLVLNDTKVIPARLHGRKETGANIEVLLLKEIEHNVWEALIKPAKRVPVGSEVIFEGDLKAKVREVISDGIRIVEFDADILDKVDDIGQMPVPPYVKRDGDKSLSELDKERYQTVYAKNPGAVAAPTAGLHFTESMLKAIRSKGVKTANIVLHVGLGTFKPVEMDDITSHNMHSEYREISKETADIINETKKKGRSVIAVGTTVARSLESACNNEGLVQHITGQTDIFIYPPYKFNVVDKMITNFHLPKSTLLMMISAFAGKDFLFNAYEAAKKQNYRFYSYGDAMLVT